MAKASKPKGPRHFLTLHDWEAKELVELISLASRLKKKPYGLALRNKTVAMLFAKPSTRTRVSLEVAINQLGGSPIYLDLNTTQLSRGESIKDTAKVLSKYSDAIAARLFAHSEIEELAKNSDVPVMNALTDSFHPFQALADAMTIKELFGKWKGLKVAFIGDGSSNVCHSLMHASVKFGFELWVGCPKQYNPDPIVASQAPDVMVGPDPRGAIDNANIVYTDTWVSIGQEGQAWIKTRALKPYQVDQKLMALANPKAVFMHDLPAHRGQEVTDEVIDGPQSVVYQQAANRLHTEKALLLTLLKKKR